MRVDGACFRQGQRFVVLREFDAKGEDGPVRCLTLGNERGDYVMQVDKCDVDLERSER